MMGQRGRDLAASCVVLADEQHFGKLLLHPPLRLGDRAQSLTGEALDDHRQEVRTDGRAVDDRDERLLHVALDGLR
jgi:hypothetical protein